MKFEIHVIQKGNIESFDDEFINRGFSTVVAIFKVDANTLDDALLELAKSKEFQDIDRVVDLAIGVCQGLPTYELGGEEQALNIFGKVVAPILNESLPDAVREGLPEIHEPISKGN